MFAKALTIVALGCTVPTCGFALGIRLFDHDAFATARGDAFVATADNPSAIYYNPAGITQLEGHNARGALNVVNMDSEFDGRGTRDVSTRDQFIPLPGFFYTYSPTNFPLSFGAGYYMPFGFSIDWPKNGPFRTVTAHGKLQYHTLNGIVAWQATKTLSIAAGPTLNYSYADLRRGIFSSGDQFKFTGDDFTLGASAGLLWQPATKHSFGVSYRSPTTLDLEGKSSAVPSSYGIPKQDASVRLPLPQVITGGYSYRPTPQWNLEVDLDWTDWNRVNTLSLKQGNPPGPITLPLNWQSSFAVEFGVTRYFDNGLHLSAGYIYLENSVPTKTFSPLVPDQDLHVFSAGIGGQHKKLSWDATYQVTTGLGRDVSGSAYGPTVSGHYTFVAHQLSLSLGYHF